ncbi:MAG: serine protease, partial [Firmicutes bacterium]|nr:serine protease [Bacillota bacterium]
MKMPRFRLRLMGVFLILLMVSAAVIGAEKKKIEPIPEATPIALGPEGSKPVVFQRVASKIPVGKNVGTLYDGILKLPKYQYRWGTDVIVDPEELVLDANQTLKACGYTVPGGDNPLFDTGQEAKATFQLGGLIADFLLETYGALAGNRTEIIMTVEWQLFDTLQKKVVYSTTTSGYGKAPGISGEAITFAFRAALKELLAKEDFVALLRPEEETAKAPIWDKAITIVTSKGKGFKLPDEMEKVLNSTVGIRAGSTVASGALGSGDGYILTAEHVVAGVEEVMVILKSGLNLPAKVIRTDPGKDLALLKIPGSGYQPLTLALGGRA